ASICLQERIRHDLLSFHPAGCEHDDMDQWNCGTVKESLSARNNAIPLRTKRIVITDRQSLHERHFDSPGGNARAMERLRAVEMDDLGVTVSAPIRLPVIFCS